MADVLELRLPAKTEYLPVVRAAIGVIAGGMGFNYDEIVQLRVAVTEAAELTVEMAGRGTPSSAPMEMVVRFTVVPDQLEIVIPSLRDAEGRPVLEVEAESEALLESLLDEVEVAGETGGEPLFRMVKYKEAPKA